MSFWLQNGIKIGQPDYFSMGSQVSSKKGQMCYFEPKCVKHLVV